MPGRKACAEGDPPPGLDIIANEDKSRCKRNTLKYFAVTRDEQNAADRHLLMDQVKPVL